MRDRCGNQDHRHIPIIFIFRKEKLVSECVEWFGFGFFPSQFPKVRIQRILRNLN